MPTIQIWATNDDMDILRRLKEYFEYQQEREFKDKAWRMSYNRKKRIRRETINDSYIYRRALNSFWNENEIAILEFERRKKHR